MGVVRGASIYQKIINLATAFLVGGSVVVIGIAFILVYNFHVQDLDFWHSIFAITPRLIFCVGVFTFIIGIYGVIISNLENRVTLIILAVLLSFASVLQLFSVHYSGKLTSTIMGGDTGGKGIEEIRHYQEEGWEWVQPKWDRIQSRLRCCGSSQSFNTGYQDYSAADSFQAISTTRNDYSYKRSVPDSCCKEPEDGCGLGLFDEANDIFSNFYKDGCLGVLIRLLRSEGTLVLGLYKGVGLVLALVELVAGGVVVVYIVQIRRNINNPDTDFHSNDDDASQKLIKK